MLRRIQHGSHEGVTLHSVSIYLYDGRHGQQDTRMRCGILGSHIKEAMRNIKTAMHCQSTHRSWLMNLNEDAPASARTSLGYSSPASTVIARTAPCTDMKGGTQPANTIPDALCVWLQSSYMQENPHCGRFARHSLTGLTIVAS